MTTNLSSRGWTLNLSDDSDEIEGILQKIVGDATTSSRLQSLALEKELEKLTTKSEAWVSKKEKRQRIEQNIEQRLIRKRQECERAEAAWRDARLKTRSVMRRLSGVSEDIRNTRNTITQNRNFLDNFAGVYTEDAFRNRAFMVMSIRDKIDESVPVKLYNDVDLKRLSLTWRTGDIYINSPDGGSYNYNFGKFNVEVVLRYDGGSRLVDTVIGPASGNMLCGDEYIHPHIQSRGNPCLGNVGRMLLDHMANQDVAQVIYTITEYLCHYNERDPFKKLMYWGVANPQDMPRMASISEYLEFDRGERRACGLSSSDCMVLHTMSGDECIGKSFDKTTLDKFEHSEAGMQKLKEALSHG